MASADPESTQARHEPRRAGHVGPVLVSERVQHQLLLAPNAERIEGAEAGETREPGNPVRKQERLRQGPEPKSRVHRMTNAGVHTVRHELVRLAHVERNRPVPAELAVAEIEHRQRCECRRSTEPALKRSEGIVGADGKAGRDIKKGQDAEPRKGDREEHPLAAIPGAVPNGSLARPAYVRTA